MEAIGVIKTMFHQSILRRVETMFSNIIFRTYSPVSQSMYLGYVSTKMSLFNPRRFLLVATILFGQNAGILIKDVDWCASPYCKVKRDHTICQWGLSCAPERGCETNLEFNKEMKDYVMELHNKKRNLVALGEEHEIPEAVRKASNMKVMQWDIHLEYVARCHSRQCDRKHDDCRVVPRFSEVGQNIYTHSFTKEEAAGVEAKDVIDKAIEAWYSEVAHVPEEIYTEWGKTEKPSDRFTQMIWAKTGYMGCGLSQKQIPDNSVEYFLVCNYAFEGNEKEKPIYTVGEPCSKCLKGKSCNAKYKGLCGEITEHPLKCPCEEEDNG